MSGTKRKKKQKIKNFVIDIEYSSHQRRYIKATSAKEARQMFDDGNLDTEYDFDECCENDKVISVKEVK